MIQCKFTPLLHIFSTYFQTNDPVIAALYESTEEGQKVTRNAGDKHLAVFVRLPSDVDKDNNR